MHQLVKQNLVRLLACSVVGAAFDRKPSGDRRSRSLVRYRVVAALAPAGRGSGFGAVHHLHMRPQRGRELCCYPTARCQSDVRHADTGVGRPEDAARQQQPRAVSAYCGFPLLRRHHCHRCHRSRSGHHMVPSRSCGSDHLRSLVVVYFVLVGARPAIQGASHRRARGSGGGSDLPVRRQSFGSPHRCDCATAGKAVKTELSLNDAVNSSPDINDCTAGQGNFISDCRFKYRICSRTEYPRKLINKVIFK
jgi:hypothetical protein